MKKSNVYDDFIPTQFLKKDFKLSDVLDKDFLDSIKHAFDCDDVSVINLSILINNKDSEKEIVSFNYKNEKDKENNLVLVDLNRESSFKKIKDIF
ncbi:hypothetical protein [uncultured Methanobrevibacter sp.]|uniref:hypothetical protein n=1 Tax=uncultured Methanobrevibacter sp. TaxID=253161 RepID=UPI0025F2E5EA|nr:hypothetical protein [uncultured Methanobrevibacter sp.]MBE6500464.1 hypothetical protein [Methanobrevibacter thaueri]